MKVKSREEEMEVELDCIAACNSPDSGRFHISLDWKSFEKVRWDWDTVTRVSVRVGDNECDDDEIDNDDNDDDN